MANWKESYKDKTGKKDPVTGQITKQPKTESDLATMSDEEKVTAFGVGRAFHFFRLRADMKKRQMAQAIGLTNQRYRWAEQGETVVDDKHMLAFCKELKVDVAEFGAKAAAFEKAYAPKENRKKKKEENIKRIGKVRLAQTENA